MVHQSEHLLNNKFINMKKINILYAITGFCMMVSLGSCKKNDYNAGGTAVQPLANEWWVHFAAGDADYPASQYFNLATYNTAANLPTEMWFDDMNNGKSFWDVKGKVAVNGLNFSGANVANQDYTSTFTVTNGKVITNGAHAPGSKDVTDSIYFQIQFSDEPGVTHTVAGYARTRFPEDDH